MTEWNASDYARHSDLQRAMAEKQLGLLTLDGTERVLDVGCGDGKISAEIAARVPRGSVLGVDPSRDMIGFASRQFGAAGHPNLRFAVGDARRLPYREAFDLVVSFNALHWVAEQDAALRSIRASLTPSGRALLRLVPEGSRRSLEDVLEDVRQEPRWVGYFAEFRKPYAHFTPAEYRALVERNGFAVRTFRVEDEAWDFETREDFVAFGRATFVEWTRCLPEPEQGAFIGDVLDRYREV